MKKPIIERFEKYYIPEPNSGCWLWIGAHSRKSGYGNFFLKTDSIRIKMAHRASVFLYHKIYIPDLCVLHKCDNPACVNPDHLFQGTQKDNAIDRVNKNRSNLSVLKDIDIIEIRKLKISGLSIREIQSRYSHITYDGIAKIIGNRRWKYLQEPQNDN